MRRGIATLLLILIFAVPSLAQRARSIAGKTRGAQAQRALPTVDQILARYVQSIGGAEALGKLTTRIAKGTVADETRQAA
jgi:hypothetical protein